MNSAGATRRRFRRSRRLRRSMRRSVCPDDDPRPGVVPGVATLRPQGDSARSPHRRRRGRNCWFLRRVALGSAQFVRWPRTCSWTLITERWSRGSKRARANDRPRQPRKVYTRDAGVQRFDSIDGRRCSSPSSRRSPYYLRQQVALRSAPGPPWSPPRRAFIFSAYRRLLASCARSLSTSAARRSAWP